MTKEIIIPPGEDGDEAVRRIVPQLYRVAEGKRKERHEQ